MRSPNALGRMAPRHAHVTLLAARRLLQNPGLRSVLDALRAYREDRAGKVGCNLAHFADVLKDSRWLFRERKKYGSFCTVFPHLPLEITSRASRSCTCAHVRAREQALEAKL